MQVYRVLVYAEPDRRRDDPNRVNAADAVKDKGYLYGDIVKVFRADETPGPASTTRCIILEVNTDTAPDGVALRAHRTQLVDGEDRITFKRTFFVDLDTLLAGKSLLAREYRGYAVTGLEFVAAVHSVVEFGR